MVLTQEQRERIECNRKRALEIKRKKEIEREIHEKSTMVAPSCTTSNDSFVFDEGGFIGETKLDHKKRKTDMHTADAEEDVDKKRDSARGIDTDRNVFDSADESSLEDFERDAPTHISQAEAKRVYCIPQGTLAVCSFIEKDNPHQRSWAKMKLYSRRDVRRRARKRFGGKDGLAHERERRKKNRLEKDLKEMKDVFS